MTFKKQVIEDSFKVQEQFKCNVKYIAEQRNLTITDLYNKLKAEGIRSSRTSFYKRPGIDQYRFISIVFITAFATILNVPTWLLLSDDVEADFPRFR